MNKVLIIGQAPPAVKQSIPYDTTMLYDILEWVGINKEKAQTMFEFEAVSNVFNGHGENGHNRPTKQQMDKHWEDTLENKVILADRVWILGNVAKDYFLSKQKTWSCNLEIIYTVHPSKRNYSRIMNQRGNITKTLLNFIPQSPSLL